MKTKIKVLLRERINNIKELNFIEPNLDNWIDVLGWNSLGNGKLIINKVGTIYNFPQMTLPNILKVNHYYKLTYTRSESRGSTHFSLGGNSSTSRYSKGRYTEVLKSNGSTLSIYGPYFDGSIWDIKLEPIDYESFYLDLYQDEAIETTYQNFDINTLDKTASYSKSFKIPATANNIKIFENAHIIESNQDRAFFNRNIQCEVFVEDVLIFEGNLYLNKLYKNVNGNLNEFEVNLYSFNLDLFQTLGDQLIVGNNDPTDDLDFSLYDHTLDIDNILESWRTHFIDNNDNYGISKGVVYPPLLSMNTTSFEAQRDNILYTETQRPAFFAKEILDKIMEDAGFTYESKFLNSNFFKSLIIYSGDKKDTSQLDKELYSFRSGLTQTVQTEKRFLSQYVSWQDPNQEARFDIVPINNDDRSNAPDTKWYDSWNYMYDNFKPSLTNPYAIINKAGKYKFNANVSIRYFLEVNRSSDYIANNAITLHLNKMPTGRPGGCTLVVEQWRNNKCVDYHYGIEYEGFIGFGEHKMLTFYPNETKKFLGNLTVDVTSKPFTCNNGDKFYLKLYHKRVDASDISMYSLLGSIDGTRGVYFGVEFQPDSTVFYSELIDSNELSYGERVLCSDWLPKSLLKADYITELIKLFNLKIDDKTNKTKHLLIEPYEEYYKLGNIKDFTRYWDTNSTVTVNRNEALINKHINLTMSKGDDYYNSIYEEVHNKVFGRQLILSEEDGRDEYLIESKFIPTVMKKLTTCSNLQLPYLDQNERTSVSEYKYSSFGLRIGFWHDQFGVDGDWNRQYNLQDGDSLMYTNYTGSVNTGFKQGNSICFTGPIYRTESYYPDGNEPKEILESDHILYYGISNEYYAPINLNNPKVPTLYNKYFKKMFDEIFTINSKLVNLNIILNPTELYNLKMYDMIYIEPNYYIILSINNYNNLNYNTNFDLLLLKETELTRNLEIGKFRMTGRVIPRVDDNTKRLDNRLTNITALTQNHMKFYDSSFSWTAEEINMRLLEHDDIKINTFRNDMVTGINIGSMNQIGNASNVLIAGNKNRVMNHLENVTVFGDNNDVEFSNSLYTTQRIVSTAAPVHNVVVIDYGRVNERTLSSASPVNYIDGGKSADIKMEGSYGGANKVDPISNFAIVGDLDGNTDLKAMYNSKQQVLELID